MAGECATDADRGTVPEIWRGGRADVDALRALKEEVVDTTWGPSFPRRDVDAWKARFTSREYFLDRLPAPGRPMTTFFAVGAREAPDGMIALKVREGRAYIGDLYVRAPGHGLGRQLLDHAKREGEALGLDVAVADVLENNQEAYELLLSDGFRPHDRYVEASLGTHVIRMSRALTKRQLEART